MVSSQRASLTLPCPERDLDRLLRAVLEEDLGSGDLTSEAVLGPETLARARLIARAPGVLAGLSVFARVFTLLDPGARVEPLAADGQPVERDQELCRIVGRARALLAGERSALNLIQRLSGIATLTARFVAAAQGRARILDTRKTTPGLRLLEKYAVRCGGGENHRFGLFDQGMLKNNHLDLAGGDLAGLIARVRAHAGPDRLLSAEARDASEALAGVRGGADVVLLDNLDPAALRELCPRLRQVAAEERRAVELEASGGITLENVADYARSGVDRLSIGALTHSAPALDLALRMERSA